MTLSQLLRSLILQNVKDPKTAKIMVDLLEQAIQSEIIKAETETIRNQNTQ
tara:strand:- start:160 stop:312 length:153 start_codon:yes stop_codon:yes gene_type:complete